MWDKIGWHSDATPTLNLDSAGDNAFQIGKNFGNLN